MTYLQAIVLGIVQGLTEFLPVSSSGHLVLLNKFFGIEDNFIFFSVLLHLATLFAVIFVLRKEIWELIKHPFSKLAIRLYIATVPTVIIALLFKSLFKEAFGGAILPICFIITAILLIVTDLFSREKDKSSEIKSSSAIIMGIAQGFAMLPGISRSGSTICAGLLCGESRTKVAKFSFLMSIPIIIASMLFEIIDMTVLNEPLVLSIGPSIVGFLLSFIVGVFAIKFMLRLVEKSKYWVFSIYLFIIGAISLFF